MKKNTKKNNKGFSLVELIVVVLIMAIIAVALAPQVMKWVNNARIATDRQTVDSVKANIQLALADEKAFSETKGKKITVTLKKSPANATLAIQDVTDVDGSSFGKQFYEICGSKEGFEKTYAKTYASGKSAITIEYKDGAFTVDGLDTSADLD
jgi:type IV pilus assembly protein PilA